MIYSQKNFKNLLDIKWTNNKNISKTKIENLLIEKNLSFEWLNSNNDKLLFISKN